MNKVFLSGTVESGPKLRLETGKPDQATFRLSAWHRAENGQWRREVYTICCQDKRAYWAMVNIEAGQRIAVEGTLLGAGQVKIAALEIEYTSGRKRTNVQAEDAQCGTTQGTRDDDADEGCEKEEPMETAEQTKELGGAQTEAQGKAQSNDRIDPRQRKWYDVGKRNGRTEVSRAGSAQGWNVGLGGKDGNKDGRFSRMGKKLLSMMLALVMALGMAVCGGAEDAMPKGERTEGVQEELYTLWDIPWGSTKDEVIQLARENGNVKVVDDEFGWLFVDDKQNVEIDGYQVKHIKFDCDENEKLDRVYISDQSRDIDELLQSKKCFESLYFHIKKRLGLPTDVIFLVFIDSDYKIRVEYTPVYMPNWLTEEPMLALEAVDEAMRLCERVIFIIHWDNVYLGWSGLYGVNTNIDVELFSHVVDMENRSAFDSSHPTWEEYKAQHSKDN